MDGKGRLRDNVFVERIRKSIKHEGAWLRACTSASQAETT
jgi:hypothetical protein